LIDHELKGDLFESVVVGFLAVSGIDAKKQIFKSPADFTPLLSGLIKIGQMLVMQRSVVAMDDGEITSPSEMLHQMHSRLLTGHSPSPLGWAIWLRAYGKKMKNVMTVAGHIRWSEDGSQVWYKEATSFRMEHFKAFIHTQVKRVWDQLDELLIPHPCQYDP
jgi:alkylated DNA repair dioxygenase AlkB